MCVYIGDDSLYGFWMDLNHDSVACRPWSQSISRLSSAHLPEDDQWQSESYFPYGRMGSADSALQWINHTFCLVSWVSCYIPHCILRRKNGAAHREVNFHISTVPSDLENFAPQGWQVTWFTPQKKGIKIDVSTPASVPGTCRFVPPRNLWRISGNMEAISHGRAMA